MTDETTKYILERIELVRSDIAEMRKDQVSRAEHTALTARVTVLETDARNRHTPWPLIVSAVCAALAAGMTIFR